MLGPPLLTAGDAIVSGVVWEVTAPCQRIDPEELDSIVRALS